MNASTSRWAWRRKGLRWHFFGPSGSHFESACGAERLKPHPGSTWNIGVRPASSCRCFACDVAEMKANGWDETGAKA